MDVPSIGSMNLYEGLRVGLATILVIVSIWGLVHANDGITVFLRAIQVRMRRRRSMQMSAYIIVGLLLGLQAVLVSLVVNPSLTIMMIGSITTILALLVLITVSLIQSIGWSNYEETTRGEQISFTHAEQLADMLANIRASGDREKLDIYVNRLETFIRTHDKEKPQIVYNFKFLQEMAWFVGVAVVIMLAQTLQTFDPSTVSDWHAWILALAGAAARTVGGAVLNFFSTHSPTSTSS